MVCAIFVESRVTPASMISAAKYANRHTVKGRQCEMKIRLYTFKELMDRIKSPGYGLMQVGKNYVFIRRNFE